MYRFLYADDEGQATNIIKYMAASTCFCENKMYCSVDLSLFGTRLLNCSLAIRSQNDLCAALLFFRSEYILILSSSDNTKEPIPLVLNGTRG